MRKCLVMVVALVAGCGGDDDCCTVDAFVFRDGPALPAMHHHYVIDRELVPTTNTQAREYGIDLNGDGTIDNQLGMVISTLSAMGLDTQTDIDKLIDTGTMIMLADIGADDLTSETAATFTIYQGTNPMPPACASAQDIVCRKHLTGAASFTAKPTPVDPALLGQIVSSKLTAGQGHLTIPFALWGSTPVLITLLGARVDLTSTATGSMGKLGGGVTKTDLDTKIIPAMRSAFEAAVMRDCTDLSNPAAGCGCIADTTGKTLLGLFDTSPKDCSISVSEVQNNSLITSLFAPDVTLEGTLVLSLGVSVHAVGASYIAP